MEIEMDNSRWGQQGQMFTVKVMTMVNGNAAVVDGIADNGNHHGKEEHAMEKSATINLHEK